MGFEDLLKKKLGPMKDLMVRSRQEAPDYQADQLFYRRAVGIEARMKPSETWSQIELGLAGGDRFERMSLNDASILLSLTSWTPAAAINKKPADLTRWVAQNLLFFSLEEPTVSLTGESNALEDPEQRIARRASMWPAVAVETAVQVAPMPFMPCGRDLVGAEMVGVRFASLERGTEVLGCTITGDRQVGTSLRLLLPLLSGDKTQAEILDALPKRERSNAKKYLSLLDRFTVLEKRDAPPFPSALLAEPTEPQVTWLGHAAVLIQTAGKNLLVDPLFFSISEPEAKHVEAKFDARALPPIDAVFITHGENDHLNANSLVQIARDTPIYIPRAPDPAPPYQVDMRSMLTVLGFENIYELAEWSRVRLDDVTVTACPFVGESWDLDLAQQTFLVESDALSVFLSADSFVMDDVYDRIKQDHRTVDLAFMGVGGCAETYGMPTGFGYGNFYRDWIPHRRINEWVQHCAGPKEAAASLARFAPHFAFGYAAGGASYIKMQYSDTGDHDQLAALLEQSETRPVALPLGQPVKKSALAKLANSYISP